MIGPYSHRQFSRVTFIQILKRCMKIQSITAGSVMLSPLNLCIRTSQLGFDCNAT